MIEVNNIIKSFNGTNILNNINAVFERGKANLIIGQSGSGKTVLLKCIIGLFEVNEGTIFYDGINFTELGLKKRKKIRKEIGMLFQGSALFDSATVEENVMYPLNMFTDLSQEEKLDRANFCLHRVNLDNVNKQFPAELSGGMKKRAGIARAIALNPRYLFCDEPNSGLDPKTAIVIDNLIKEITEEFNTTTIINTHDMNSVMEIADKIFFIHNSQKWWEGKREEIFNTDNKELNEFVFASKLTQKLRSI